MNLARDLRPNLFQGKLPHEQSDMPTQRRCLAQMMRRGADQMLDSEELRRRDQLIVAGRQHETGARTLARSTCRPKAMNLPVASSLRL